MLEIGDCPAEFLVGFPMPCIEPIITGHLEMLFRDMLDKEGNKVHDRESFFHIGIILVFVVVESHVTAIVRINTGGGNNRPAKVTADVFYDSVRVTEIWFGIDIETIFIFFVNGGFGLFKRRADTRFQLIQESGLESLPEIGIVEIFHNPPEAVIRETAFGKKTVDMGIPFERPAEGMEDADETGHKVPAFVQSMEESEDDTADSLKKGAKEGTVIQKERAQVFINGKNEVPVGTANEFKGHYRRAVNTVFIAAGGAKLGMAAERNKFKFAAVGTAIHCAAIRRIPAIDHFINVFHDNGTGMKDIFNFFIVFFKNLLEDVHKSIMKE